MKNIIINYLNKITIDDINNYLITNDIYLSKEELKFTYQFIKNNFIIYLNDIDNFNIDDYKNYYNSKNFEQIKSLYEKAYQKYAYLIK